LCIYHFIPTRRSSDLMAPLFDNGSSLSYGETDEQLARYQDIDAYIRRGRHHCAWDGGLKGDRHLDLCKLFFETYKPAGVAREFVDRKSTRLNSSHVKI